MKNLMGFVTLLFLTSNLSLAFTSYANYQAAIESCLKAKTRQTCDQAYKMAKTKSAELDEKYLEILMNKQTASLSMESSIESLRQLNSEAKRFNQLTFKLQAMPHFKFNRYILEAERSLKFQSEHLESAASPEAQAWNDHLNRSFKERAKLQAVGWLDRVRYR